MLSMDVIESASIFWWEKYGNSPDLVVKFKPDFDTDILRQNMVYDYKEGTFFATNDLGVASFFAHPDDGRNHGGFGGSSYDLTMSDGSIKTIKGPWSSRSGAMNKLGWPPTDEVVYIGGIKNYRIGSKFTRELILQIMETFLPEINIWVRDALQEEILAYSTRPDQLSKPSGASFYGWEFDKGYWKLLKSGV